MEILNTIGGAFFLVFTWWLAEKNMADKKNGKVNWKQWASKNWDDAMYAVACGFMLGFYRLELLSLLIYVRELDPHQTIHTYQELQKFILFGLGFFGTSIVKLLISGVGSILNASNK